MEKQIVELIKHTWIIIAWIISIIKWIYQVRIWNFRLLIFITDLALSLPIGWITWELVVDMNIWLAFKFLFVWYMTANAFVWTSILFNPKWAKWFFDLFRKIFIKSMESKYNIDLSDKEKK